MFSTYVLEYLLGQYCATSDEPTIQTGIETVKEILAKNYMANKSFSRGVETLGAEASMMSVGNTQQAPFTVAFRLWSKDHNPLWLFVYNATSPTDDWGRRGMVLGCWCRRKGWLAIGGGFLAWEGAWPLERTGMRRVIQTENQGIAHRERL